MGMAMTEYELADIISSYAVQGEIFFHHLANNPKRLCPSLICGRKRPHHFSSTVA